MGDIEQNRDELHETAVDDVRRIRERLDHESGGNIQSHIQRSIRALEKYREKLSLIVVQPPKAKTK